jgi:drug/metabolite transporter (DMT)-like permease
VAGLLIVLLSSVFFCFQNVIVRILFTQQSLFSIWEVGGFVPPTLSHSLLLLLLRMLWVVPLMAVMANYFYQGTWREIRQLLRPNQQQTLWGAIGCGLLMFLYLVLLYIAISLIPTGIAITLFFTYPIFTALLAWRLFNDAPSLFRWTVIALTLIGTLLTIPYTYQGEDQTIGLGIATGIASGFAYAGYTVFAQKILHQLHPVPFTWISFTMTLLLSALSLAIWHPTEGTLPWLPLLIWSLLSALFTFAGHVLNNWGIHLIGASRAAIIGATNPALTAVLAGLTIQETLNALQILGVFVVTFSVALLNYEAVK